MRSVCRVDGIGLVVVAVACVALGCGTEHAELGRSPSIAASPPAASATSPSAETDWPFVVPADQDATSMLARLAKDPGPIKSNWVPPDKSERYGRAEGLIAAPYSAVRARLVDTAHYQALAGPKFSKVHVVGKEPGGTDVYFNLPIMHGLVRLWYVTRFGAPHSARAGEIIEGTFVKGNLRTMHIVFTLQRGHDEASTAVSCDLLLSLTIPAPQANVDEELRDACGDAINALRRTTAPPAPAAAAP